MHAGQRLLIWETHLEALWWHGKGLRYPMAHRRPSNKVSSISQRTFQRCNTKMLINSGSSQTCWWRWKLQSWIAAYLDLCEEKWASVKSKFKHEHNVPFPPFCVFVDFISTETRTRTDPCFNTTLFQMSSAKRGKPVKSVQTPVAVHKTLILPAQKKGKVDQMWISSKIVLFMTSLIH